MMRQRDIRIVVAGKFIGSITKRGNKTKAVSIFDTFLLNLKIRFGVSPLDFLTTVFDVARPKVFLVTKKIAGLSHKIPAPVTKVKSYTTVIKWFLSASRKRKSAGNIPTAIYEEFIDIYTNSANQVLKKRDEYHRLARLNKPFLRYHKFL